MARATRGQSETGDALLLTPGPLTTSKSVKTAMLHDWGSRDAGFLKLNREVLEWLPEVVNAGGKYAAVPMQGSGTFAVEAMLTTFVPRKGKCLVLINGAYGHRAKKILDIAGRENSVYETPEDTPPDLGEVKRILEEDSFLTHIFAVHCETTSGIENPIEAIAELAMQHGRHLLVDAMSAFGALPLDAPHFKITAVAASSNKCIEGVPGLGFVICQPDALNACKGNATTLVLDLYDQWTTYNKTGQYRFTPPIQIIAAFHQALTEFRAEGSTTGRGHRYAENARALIDGMRDLGFKTLLPDALQAPIIVTFHMPKDPAFVFQTFYDKLKDRGYIIYPGKLTVADSFRIGCIGRLNEGHMRDAVANVREVMEEMKVGSSKRD